MKALFSLALVGALATAALADPASFIDLGTISDSVSGSGADLSTSVTLGPGTGATAFQFYRFTLASAIASPGFLGIDTTPATGATTGDTEIALYSSTGALLVQDDDDNVGLYSQLSFGAGTGVAQTATGFTTGLNSTGQDGALAAGTYFLAVAQFNATFTSNYTVTTTATGSLTPTLNFRTNVGSPVPEPATMAALGFGALALVRRRRAR